MRAVQFYREIKLLGSGFKVAGSLRALQFYRGIKPGSEAFNGQMGLRALQFYREIKLAFSPNKFKLNGGMFQSFAKASKRYFELEKSNPKMILYWLESVIE